MHVLLAIVGACLVLALGQGPLAIALLGALGGLLAAELLVLRRRIARLEADRSSPPLRAPAEEPPAPSPMAREAPPAGAAVESPPPPSFPPHRPWPPYRPSFPASGEVEPVAVRLGRRIWGPVRDFLTGGNTVARAGVLILFFGMAFLLRYLVEHAQVPLVLRLAAVGAGGALLLALGLVLAPRRRAYGLVLQAGGVGVMYLTAFVALRIFSLLSPVPAVAMLVALSALSAALAVLQSARALAVLALTCGFLAPVLTASGDESPRLLFGYYAVLNGSILGIAWLRSWRELNCAGLVLTVVLAAAWGVLHYHDSLFSQVEPFVGLFLLLYLAIALLFAFRQPPGLRGYVDATIVFGAPIAALGFQSGLLHGQPHALAASALVLAGLYGLLSWLLRRLLAASHRLLSESFAALAVVFLTAALPLATDGRHWAVTWALEGAALVWVGCRQLRALSRAAGALLILAAGGLCWLVVTGPPGELAALPLAAGDALILDCVSVGIAAVLAAVLLRRHAARLLPHEETWPHVLLLWGLGWWLYGGLLATGQHVDQPWQLAAALILVAATAVLIGEIGVRTPLPLARMLALWLLPVLYVFAVAAAGRNEHPFAYGGALAWPLAFAAFYVICARHDQDPQQQGAGPLHTAGAWLLTALATWECAWQLQWVSVLRGPWPSAAWALLPALVLAVLPWLTRHIAWPFRHRAATYREWIGGGIAAYLAVWSAVSYLALPHLAYAGPGLPVLNAVDLAEVGVLLVLAGYWRALSAAAPDMAAGRQSAGTLAAALISLAAAWLHVIVLRSLHFWAGIDYELAALLRSTLVQTALSILWATVALLCMLAATWRRSRPLWIAGAAVLGGVILKLFLIDLSGIGTIERIVSFIGVGVLTLLIGYFAPGVPADRTPQAEGRDAGGS